MDTLHIVVVRDGRFWFVQGLEADVAAQGDTMVEAIENFAFTLDRIDAQNGGSLPSPAPDEIWTEYGVAGRLAGLIQACEVCTSVVYPFGHEVPMTAAQMCVDKLQALIDDFAMGKDAERPSE